MSRHLSADVRTCPQTPALQVATVDARAAPHRAGREVTASRSARDYSRSCPSDAGDGGAQAEFACQHGQRAPGSASPGRRGTPSVRGGDAWAPRRLGLVAAVVRARPFILPCADIFGHLQASAPGAYSVPLLLFVVRGRQDCRRATGGDREAWGVSDVERL
jgi:hypothetical protein